MNLSSNEKKKLKKSFFERTTSYNEINVYVLFKLLSISGFICPRIETTETHTIKFRWFKMKTKEEDFFIGNNKI